MLVYKCRKCGGVTSPGERGNNCPCGGYRDIISEAEIKEKERIERNEPEYPEWKRPFPDQRREPMTTKWKYRKGALLKKTSQEGGASMLILKRDGKSFYRVLTLWNLDTASWSKDSLEKDYECLREINL